MVFWINGKKRKNCSLEEIKLYESDINYLIVYKYLIDYFGLCKSDNDVIDYRIYSKEYILVNNSNCYYVSDNIVSDNIKNNSKHILDKKYIIRDLKIKNILNG